MATENRVVRPFRVPDAVQDWLEDSVRVRIELLDDGMVVADPIDILPGETKRPDGASVMRSRISLYVDEAASFTRLQDSLRTYAKGLGDPTGDSIVCALFGTTSYLRFTEELGRWTIPDLVKLVDPYRLADGMQDRPGVLRTPVHGCTLDFVVMLARDLAPRTLYPHRRGTWLGRVRFEIGNTMEGLGFRPIPLTFELRKEFGLGKETVRFARQNRQSDGLLDSSSLDDFLEVYVDADLLQGLSAAPWKPHSVVVQTEIFLSAVQYVVLEAARCGELKGKTIADLGESLVTRLIRGIGNESKEEMERWLAVLRDDPLLFMAKWEEVAGYNAKLGKLLVAMA